MLCADIAVTGYTKLPTLRDASKIEDASSSNAHVKLAGPAARARKTGAHASQLCYSCLSSCCRATLGGGRVSPIVVDTLTRGAYLFTDAFFEQFLCPEDVFILPSSAPPPPIASSHTLIFSYISPPFISLSNRHLYTVLMSYFPRCLECTLYE
jgi:hypothetical protein